MSTSSSARLQAFTIVMGSCWLGTSPGYADEGVVAYERGSPGVVLIRAATATGSVNETGSGFVISKSGYILTASHVVPEGVSEGGLFLSASLGPNTAAPVRTYRLKIVERSKKYDAMLLQIIDPPNNLYPLPLRKKRAMSGERLFVLGYPLGFPDVHIVDGIVGAVSDSDITTNSLVNKGNSGGPILDVAGCVFGLIYSGIERHDGEVVSGIKFAVPLTAISDLVPRDAELPTTASSTRPLVGVIHVSDTLSRTQTDHPAQLGDFVRQYEDRISARPGFVIETIEGVDKNSLNPPQLQYPTPVLSADKKSMALTYSLVSGPIYDQRRGWIEMTIHTRQRPISAANEQLGAANPCQ